MIVSSLGVLAGLFLHSVSPPTYYRNLRYGGIHRFQSETAWEFLAQHLL